MFINYLVDELSEFMVVYDLALVHELLSLWPFMNKPCSWTKWEFMNRIGSWSHELSWKSHLSFKNIDEPFMNTLINVYERS